MTSTPRMLLASTRRRLGAGPPLARVRTLLAAPRARYRLFLLALLAAALFSFGHVTEDYLTGDPLVRWDLRFAAWLHAHSSDPLVSVFKVVTTAGNPLVLAALTALGLALLLRRRALADMALLAGVALGIELLNGALKLLFHRPRPELGFLNIDTYSFPSGHAAGSTAVFGILVYLLARGAARRRQVVLGAGAVALVGLIGFSRLYLGVHYLSDVLGGTALGAAWLAACLLVYDLRRSS